MTKIDTKDIADHANLEMEAAKLSETTLAKTRVSFCLHVLCLCNAYDEAQKEIEGLKEVIADKQRLTREIDVAINGDGAAKQASLCDILSQLKHQKPRIVAFGSHEELEKFKQDLNNKKDARISSLEALLRECLEIEDHITDEDGMCNICYCHMTKHDETCYISRIQKELGEV